MWRIWGSGSFQTRCSLKFICLKTQDSAANCTGHSPVTHLINYLKINKKPTSTKHADSQAPDTAFFGEYTLFSNCSSSSFSNSLGDSKGESWGTEGQIFVRKYIPLLHVLCLRKSWVSIIWEQLVLQEEKCYTVGGKLSMGSSFTLDIRQALSCSTLGAKQQEFFTCRQEATSSNLPGLGWHHGRYHITEERWKPASRRN